MFVRQRTCVSVTLPLAVFFFLVSCDAFAPGRSPGEKLYRNHCANCHGVKGDGQTVRYMGNTWANLTDDYWKHGGDRSSLEHTLRTEVVFKHPPFGLSTQEIRQVVDHVVQLRSKKR